MIQALIEREIRQQMRNGALKSLAVYPEDREATHPTTTKVFDVFDQVSTYRTVSRTGEIEEYQDALSETQRAILKLMNIEEAKYWETPMIRGRRRKKSGISQFLGAESEV